MRWPKRTFNTTPGCLSTSECHRYNPCHHVWSLTQWETNLSITFRDLNTCCQSFFQALLWCLFFLNWRYCSCIKNDLPYVHHQLMVNFLIILKKKQQFRCPISQLVEQMPHVWTAVFLLVSWFNFSLVPFVSLWIIKTNFGDVRFCWSTKNTHLF